MGGPTHPALPRRRPRAQGGRSGPQVAIGHLRRSTDRQEQSIPDQRKARQALRLRARPRARPVLRGRRHQRDQRRPASGHPGEGRPGPAGATAVLVRHRLRRQTLRPARAPTRPGTTATSSAPTAPWSCTSARTSPATRPTTCSGPSSSGRRARSRRTSPRWRSAKCSPASRAATGTVALPHSATTCATRARARTAVRSSSSCDSRPTGASWSSSPW